MTKALNLISKAIPQVLSRSLFKKLNLETFLAYFALMSKYGGTGEYDIQTDGSDYTVTVHHELGEKWSNLTRHYMGQGMKTGLGIVAQFEVGRISVIARFSAP